MIARIEVVLDSLTTAVSAVSASSVTPTPTIAAISGTAAASSEPKPISRTTKANTMPITSVLLVLLAWATCPP